MRLTTNKPKDDFDICMNLFYAKDGKAWVRGGGPGPDYADVSLADFIRMIARKHGLEMAKSSDDCEIDDEMEERIFDGTDTIEGIVATLYTAGLAFSALRERLKMYEDAMPLEKVQELAKAEEDERLLVLPVKLGDTVYKLLTPTMRIKEERITSIIEAVYAMYWINNENITMPIYLTREEAEAALKKREESL